MTDADPRPLHPLVPWPAIAAGWGAVSLVFAAHEYLTGRVDGRPVALGHALYWSASEWLAWALLTPLILGIVGAAARDDGRWRWRGALLVAAAGAPIALLQIVGQAALDALVVAALGDSEVSVRSWLGGTAATSAAHVAYLVPRKLGFDYFVYWVLVAVGLLVAYYRLSRARALEAAELRAALADARLATLRQQLQPHFLFNTLNGIAELVHENPARAERMIDYLSELLRRAIRADEADLLPLGRELGFVRRYLVLQRVRFGPRLSVRMSVPRDLYPTLVPPHVLQPLVENAIQHGGPGAGQPGRIHIAARRLGGAFELTVHDLGTHPPGGVVIERTGLRATRARLERAFGRRYHLEVAPHPDGGTLARLEFPWRI